VRLLRSGPSSCQYLQNGPLAGWSRLFGPFLLALACPAGRRVRGARSSLGDLNPETGEISLNLDLNSKTGEKSPDRGVHVRRVVGTAPIVSSRFGQLVSVARIERSRDSRFITRKPAGSSEFSA
jgi:hypothetical protein